VQEALDFVRKIRFIIGNLEKSDQKDIHKQNRFFAFMHKIIKNYIEMYELLSFYIFLRRAIGSD